MNTEKLIDMLAENTKPSGRIWPAGARAAAVTAASTLLIAAAILFLNSARDDLAIMAGQARFVAETGAMAMAGILSAWAACRLSVPDMRTGRWVAASLFFSTLIWAGLCAMAFSGTGTEGMIDETQTALPAAIECTLELLALMSLPLIAMFFAVIRAWPIWHGRAGYTATLAAASFAAVGMRIICPNEGLAHLLLSHFLPVLVFALAGVLLGRAVFRFRV